jgi:replication factor A1
MTSSLPRPHHLAPKSPSHRTPQILGLTETNGKYRCEFTDGKENMSGVLTSQVARTLGAGLQPNDVVRVTEANVNSINDKHVLIVAGMEVVKKAGDHVDPPPTVDAKTPAAALKAAGAGLDITPATAVATGPSPPTSALPTAVAAAPLAAANPASAAPKPAATAPKPTSTLKRTIQPIAALNPYMSGWAVRAKVVSKGPKRSFSKNGAPAGVFSAELVDAQGTPVEATFWHAAADKYFDSIQEGGVYVFARGSVKPANKRYSTVRNDYALHFDAAAEVEACGALF